jgi:hypothetical protein
MLEVHDSRAGALFQKLEHFLGSHNVDGRLKSIARELQIERGAYRQHWVLPNRQWWLGLEEARQIARSGLSFRGRLKGRLKATLETAAEINLLYSKIPVSKRTEYKQRILAANNLQPVFMELQIASHFVQKQCHLLWVHRTDGGRISEFVVKHGTSEWEVECKTKGCDAGRRVTRPTFLRLVDAVGRPICDMGWQGICEITLPDRMPVQPAWRVGIVRTVLRMISDGHIEQQLASGERIKLSLKRRDTTVLNKDEFDRVEATKGPNHHVAFYGPIRNGQYVDPLLIDVVSEKPDDYLTDILTDLRDACKQFSGQRPALICCSCPKSIPSLD